jgi:hypothetical protein
MNQNRTLSVSAFALLAVFVACGDDDQGSTQSTGTDGTGAGSATTTGTGGNGVGGSTGFGPTSTTGTMSTTSTGIPPAPTVEVECDGHLYQCGDLIDNDTDGLMDYQDPDCLGPCDNTEDSLFGGIPGQPGPPCKLDCYWDQDSGTGNDDCYWDHQCDTHSIPDDFYPEPSLGDNCEYAGPAFEPFTGQSCMELSTMQSEVCGDVCGPLTPNGCDCFGCCELPSGSGLYVWSGSEGLAGDTVCTLDKLDDPTICHPCDPVPGCLNGCEHCELCVGKTVLPPDCLGGTGGGGVGGGTGGPECPDGILSCGTPDLPPCPANYYCITGCCQAVPQ